MKPVRLMSLVLLSAMTFAACSTSGKGGRDSGANGSGIDDGSIPVASEGSELKDIRYDFDSSSVREGERNTLKANGQWLLANPKTNVVIEGHADDRGTNEYNMALGERRAKSAFDFLRSLGVPAQQMSTISYGEELPLDQGRTEDAWAKNRRAHFATKR
jgi:peptidoglycan-associated lipoprotein